MLLFHCSQQRGLYCVQHRLWYTLPITLLMYQVVLLLLIMILLLNFKRKDLLKVRLPLVIGVISSRSSRGGGPMCVVPSVPPVYVQVSWLHVNPVQRQEPLMALVITRGPQPLSIQGSGALCPEVGRMLLTKQFERAPVIGQAKCRASPGPVHVSHHLICSSDLTHFMDLFHPFNHSDCKMQETEHPL